MSDDNQEVLTFQVPKSQIEGGLVSALQSVLATTLKGPDSRGAGAGLNYKLLEQRVNDWVRGYDFGPLLQSAMAPIVKAALQETVKAAIKNRAGQILAQMISTGELDAYIVSVIEGQVRNYQEKVASDTEARRNKREL